MISWLWVIVVTANGPQSSVKSERMSGALYLSSCIMTRQHLFVWFVIADIIIVVMTSDQRCYCHYVMVMFSELLQSFLFPLSRPISEVSRWVRKSSWMTSLIVCFLIMIIINLRWPHTHVTNTGWNLRALGLTVQCGPRATQYNPRLPITIRSPI